MSRNIAGFDQAWKILSVVLLLVVGAEAWYVQHLSARVNQQRAAQSAALERHISNQYLISKLRKEVAAAKADCLPAP